jgi:hypothetical protein
MKNLFLAAVSAAALGAAVSAHAQATSMPLGTTPSAGADYFVWNNSGSGIGNPSWNYFFYAGDALLNAQFSDGSVIDTSPVTNSICCVGPSSSTTYGEVITPATSATLTSFQLSLNGGIGNIRAGVGTWNGTSAFDFGFGSPTNLWLSNSISSGAGGTYTFTPGVALTAGQQYVVYLTSAVISTPEPSTWAMMLVGFGGLGVAMRSRRKVAAATV